jgi:MoxR-like ATPase
MTFASADEVEHALRQEDYLADRGLAVSLYLSITMGRPLLLEGEPGVGKTEVAKVLARLTGSELIRLQCYEGIDATQALYEWDYAKQLLYARGSEAATGLGSLYTTDFLLERPLLRAVRAGGRAVLLIDELDRADDEFEAFLLEVLSDFQVTIPELGTIAAETAPIVIITSNRTRELHDALKRRCLYHWIDYPSRDRETEIIRVRVPGVEDSLARSVAGAVARLREMELAKPPGPAESVDWTRALQLIGGNAVTEGGARDTLGWVLKNRDDIAYATEHLAEVVAGP